MRMENGVGVSGSLILGIAPRFAAIVFAMFLIAVSAGTIGTINNNEILDFVRETDRNRLSSGGKDLHDLINQSLSAARWLIGLSAGLLIGEAVATMFAIIDFISRSGLKLVMQILDILFSIAVAICYGATGIACAIYAAAWAEPPEVCDHIAFDCDEVTLTATNALSTIFSFIQVAVFGLIALMVIYTLVKSRKCTENSLNCMTNTSTAAGTTSM